MLISALLAAFAVQAQSTQDATQATQGKAARQSRDQALPASVRRVERETGGEVISAEPVQRDGREVYHLKVLTPNGRVRVVQEDPQEQARNSRREPDRRQDSSRQDSGRQDQGRQNQGRQDRNKDRDQRNSRESTPRSGSSDDDDNNDSQP